MTDENVTTMAKISNRKLVVNRQNAQKSTGPKTIDGKNKSKMNALKHGLRAKEVGNTGFRWM